MCIRDRTYTGQEQALITAGSVTDYGTMQYSLTENGTYSQDIPTGTDAGAYTCLLYTSFRRRLNDGVGWISACIPSIPVAFMIPFKDNFICVGKGLSLIHI